MNTAGVAAAYDRWAPVYDLVFGGVFATGRREAVAAAERIGGKVLEVGVGTGISLHHYDASTRVVGVDISESMLGKARERAMQLGGDRIQIEVGDAEDLRFADNEFDVVVAQYVISAVPNPERALDEFVRVVRPGGEIIITTREGAGDGLRGNIEKLLMPITTRLGFRTDFPFDLYDSWAAKTPQVSLVEHRALPPLGHFSLIRYKKLAG